VEDNDPTTVTRTADWGPVRTAGSRGYKLVVSHHSDGVSFDWALSGAVKPGIDFVTFQRRGYARSPADHGSGSSRWTSSGPSPRDRGDARQDGGHLVLHVGPAHLDVTFNRAKDGDPTHVNQKNNILYSYSNDTTGGGRPGLRGAQHDQRRPLLRPLPLEDDAGAAPT